MTGWQDIAGSVLARIRSREWPPGSTIPHEADLARDLGVSRATVNRALQSLAEAGWLDRRRRAGTRVASHPVRMATFAIPILRDEISATGATYGYRLIARQDLPAPPDLASLFGPGPLIHATALHSADGAAYAHEDRWIDPEAVPAIRAVDFAQTSANAWLVANAPFARGEVAMMAGNPPPDVAALFGCAPDAALLVMDRRTWSDHATITAVRLTFRPGHRIATAI